MPVGRDCAGDCEGWEFQSLEGARSALVLGSVLGLRTGGDKNSCSDGACSPERDRG